MANSTNMYNVHKHTMSLYSKYNVRIKVIRWQNASQSLSESNLGPTNDEHATQAERQLWVSCSRHSTIDITNYHSLSLTPWVTADHASLHKLLYHCVWEWVRVCINVQQWGETIRVTIVSVCVYFRESEEDSRACATSGDGTIPRWAGYESQREKYYRMVCVLYIWCEDVYVENEQTYTHWVRLYSLKSATIVASVVDNRRRSQKSRQLKRSSLTSTRRHPLVISLNNNCRP